jgi:hypothetical protein
MQKVSRQLRPNNLNNYTQQLGQLSEPSATPFYRTKAWLFSAGLVLSGLLPGPGSTYMCVMSVLRLYNVTPWLQSHWCA